MVGSFLAAARTATASETLRGVVASAVVLVIFFHVVRGDALGGRSFGAEHPQGCVGVGARKGLGRRELLIEVAGLGADRKEHFVDDDLIQEFTANHLA
jgi:hypothetical protein